MALPARVEQRAPSVIHMMEKHYDIKQIAATWAMSYDFVFDQFRDEPGVMVTGPRNARKRTRHTIRVPESVVARVYARMVNP